MTERSEVLIIGILCLSFESRVDEIELCSGIQDCGPRDTVHFDLIGDEDVGKVGHTYRVIRRCLSKGASRRWGLWCSRSEVVHG